MNKSVKNKKLLILTSPADYGSTTLGVLLNDYFNKYVDTKYFTLLSTKDRFVRSPLLAKYFFRFLYSFKMIQEIYRSRREGRKLLFVLPTPAVYALGVISPKDSYLVTDWTKKLHEPLVKANLSPWWMTIFHTLVFKKMNHIFTLTDAVTNSFLLDYSIEPAKIVKINPPFLVYQNQGKPQIDRSNEKINIIFVGAKAKGKGIDVVVDWMNKRIEKNPFNNIHLFIVTKTELQIPTGLPITVRMDIDPGSEELKSLYNCCDIFVLPTKVDAYPMSLGEAAAAGLVLITTNTALGSPEIIKDGVNGYILTEKNEVYAKLDYLCDNPEKIKEMKRNCREFMEKEFNLDNIFKSFDTYLWPEK
jgi:glycosyltransferase involved in cell wall biosynthesis